MCERNRANVNIDFQNLSVETPIIFIEIIHMSTNYLNFRFIRFSDTLVTKCIYYDDSNSTSSQNLVVNPSTAKKGVKLPQSTFLAITQTTWPSAKIPLVTFPEYVSARNGASLDFLWLRVMTCQSDVIFWEKMKLASTHLNAREL